MPEIYAPAHIHQQIVAAVTAATFPASGVVARVSSYEIHVHQGMDYRGVLRAYLAMEDEEAALADRIDWASL